MSTVDSPPPAGDIPFVEEQIRATAPEPEPTGKAPRARGRLLRPILWRLHFLGGLLAAPILLSLAITGILYAWNPQIDQVRFGDIISRSDGPSVPLSQQVASAQAAHPDWKLHSIVPGYEVSGGPDVTTAVILDPPGGEAGFSTPADGVAVYVDEATGRAKGEIPLSDMSAEVLRTSHSSWTLGAGAEPLTELAASWFLLSILTGLYLWWPGLRKRGAAAFAFRRNVRGRRQSKDWHNFLGLALLLPMLFLVITGLTWTTGAGERYDDAKAAVLSPPASGGVDTASGGDGAGSVDGAGVDRVSAAVGREGMATPVRFVAPADGTSAWEVLSEDVTFPLERDQLAVNAASGKVVDRFDYANEHWTNKLTTGGIFFHQAQLFGPVTQVVMTLLAVGIAAMIAFGYRMWWFRRPAGGWGAPPPLRDWVRNAPLALVLLVLVLAWALPTLAIALVVWLVLERAWLWWRVELDARRAARAPKVTVASPGLEACKAGLVTVVGIAMIAGPHVGDADETLGALGRLVAWAWSVPLGIVFLAAGLIGLRAMFTTGGRPTAATRKAAA